MANRRDIELPDGIKLFYEGKGSFLTVTLDLTQTKLHLSANDQQRLANFPLKKHKITSKKAVLVVLRDYLLDVMEVILEILVQKKAEM